MTSDHHSDTSGVVRLADVLERAPYRKSYGFEPDNPAVPNTGHQPNILANVRKPLIVLAGFLMRPDLTSEDERPRDPDNLVDDAGQPVDLRTAKPEDLAFEKNPYLTSEKWNEHWRKVHGGRYTYRVSDEDRSIALHLRYDQVHRVASGPSSLFPPPYDVPIKVNGSLYTDVIGRIPAYRRPQYDGFAYLAYNSVADLGAAYEGEKYSRFIVPEEQIMFRSVSHVVAAEYVIIPYKGYRPPILLIKVHVTAAGVNRAAFHSHWLGEHADLLLSKVSTHRFVRRYAQLHNIASQIEGGLFWHPVGSRWAGVTVMEFNNMTDVEDYLMSDDYRDIAADEAEWVDNQQSVYWTGISHNIIDKILNEIPTDRSRRISLEGVDVESDHAANIAF